MIVVISPTLTEKSGIVRYGISASKRIGNAVARNKLKRRFRAAIKEVYPEKFVAGYDYLMIGRKYGVDCNFEALLSDLRKALNYLKKQV
jgi:ribonuclease P protein component